MQAQNWLGGKEDTLEGFTWKHGHTPDTKGVLFWSDVFLTEVNGEKLAIIIMDTQGLFEINSTTEENARIFGLSTLASSMQIINLKDVIQENQIDYLDMATSFTKHISHKLSVEKKIDWKPFQKLLFLIRDWVDEEIEGGFGYAGGKTYLNKFLYSSTNPDSKSHSIRMNIKSSFDSINCYLLNHPGSGVSKSKYMGEWGKLEEDFVENLKTLIESILKPENLNIKSMLGMKVTGTQYNMHICEYLKAFRNERIPDVGNIFQITIDNQMKSLVSEFSYEYQVLMGNDLDLNRNNFEEYIDNKHKVTKADIIEKFYNSEKIEDPASILKYQSLLRDEIEKSFTTLRKSAMRDYQQYVSVKQEFEKLNIKNNELITHFKQEIQSQAMQNLKIQQEFDEKAKEQQKTAKYLQDQVQQLHLTNSQKEKEMKRIQDELDAKTKNYEEKLALNIHEIAKLREETIKTRQEAREREEKLMRQHEIEMNEIKKERERDREETQWKINESLEKIKTQNEEQKRESEKYIERLKREFDEREKNRELEEAKKLAERNAQLSEEKGKSGIPLESLTALLSVGNEIAKNLRKTLKHL